MSAIFRAHGGRLEKHVKYLHYDWPHSPVDNNIYFSISIVQWLWFFIFGPVIRFVFRCKCVGRPIFVNEKQCWISGWQCWILGPCFKDFVFEFVFVTLCETGCWFDIDKKVFPKMASLSWWNIALPHISAILDVSGWLSRTCLVPEPGTGEETCWGRSFSVVLCGMRLE